MVTWKRANSRRASWRRARTAGLVAAAAVTVIAARLWTGSETAVAPTPAAIVATVERVERYPSYSAGDSIQAGARIETAPDGRLALRLADRTSLRLDTSTRVQFLSARTLELAAGAIYVDNDAVSGIEVRTPRGVVRDVGTQFEVRLDSAALHISVRTGRVELRALPGASGAPGTAGPVPVVQGTQLIVSENRAETRRVAASSPLWSWAASLAPLFEIEGKPLASFLEHLGREYGWTIRYSDAQLAQQASGIILHGSIAGLSPKIRWPLRSRRVACRSPCATEKSWCQGRTNGSRPSSACL